MKPEYYIILYYKSEKVYINTKLRFNFIINTIF